jgi:glycerol-3-phosphate dehydrogenase
MYLAAFAAYGLLAGRRQHRWYPATEVLARLPSLSPHGLRGGYAYDEAGVDDARLVLRILREAVSAGGLALSYAPVERLLLLANEVAGVCVRDAESGRSAEVPARSVVNATGAAADRLRRDVGGAPAMRPLRGSHLAFLARRVPLAQAVSFRHPADGRNVFAAPWEGAVLVGTTDHEHREPLSSEPRISEGETSYLMEAMTTYFPGLGLSRGDVVSTWAGLRPVSGTRRADPSSESREGLLAIERGLVSVVAGKLTTVRPAARAALALLRDRDGTWPRSPDAPMLDAVGDAALHVEHLGPALLRLLEGRYGREAGPLVASARDGELETVPGTRSTWAQLRWAARHEGVVHLDDLMLRRTRAGLVLPEGGATVLPRVRGVCREELGWDDARWIAEEARYRELWQGGHGPPVSVD